MATDAAGDANASPSFSTYLNLANYVYNSGDSPPPYNTGTAFTPLYVAHSDGNQYVEKTVTDDGFYGQAYINNSTPQPQMIIAFEGTNLHSSPNKTFFNAQIADDTALYNGAEPNSFKDALAFTKSAINIAETDDNVSAGNIYLDGHSLGGAEAEYVSAKLNLPGATFGAPGLSSALLNVGPNASADSGLTDYVDYGDPVGNYYSGSILGNIVTPNVTIEHFGTVRNTGVQSNDSYLNQAVSFYPNNKPATVYNLTQAFLHYHVLKNYAHDLIAPATLANDDNSSGADTGFFDSLLQPLGATDPSNGGTGPSYGSTGPGECFVAGTRLMTPQGARAIEDIAPGDPVVTASGVATVIWVGRRRLDVTAHPRPSEVLPIRIAAHAFAENVPARDLYVSPGHGIAIDGALIPARLLVNGTTIAQVERARVEYWHVELERHDLVLAEGLAVESYLDCGHRAAFEGQGGAMRLHPNFLAYAAHEGSCLPWIVAGPVLDAARARFTARADETRPARDGQPAELRRSA